VADEQGQINASINFIIDKKSRRAFIKELSVLGRETEISISKLSLSPAAARGFSKSVREAFKNAPVTISNISFSKSSINKIKREIATALRSVPVSFAVTKESVESVKTSLGRQLSSKKVPINVKLNAESIDVVRARASKLLMARRNAIQSRVVFPPEALAAARAAASAYFNKNPIHVRFAPAQGSVENISRKITRGVVGGVNQANKVIQKQVRSASVARRTMDALVGGGGGMASSGMILGGMGGGMPGMDSAMSGAASGQRGRGVSGFSPEGIGTATTRLASYFLPASAFFQTIRGLKQIQSTILETDDLITRLTQIMDGNAERAQNTAAKTFETARLYGQSAKELLTVTNLLSQSGKQFAGDTALFGALDSLAKSQLGPTFGDIFQTAEGGIAFLSQFNKSGEELIDILDVAARLSKKFAVESKDLFESVKTGGAAFAALGGSVEEFQAVVSAIRQLTRLPASTIGTGLNTIVLRVFRPKNLDFLESIGVQTRNAEGQLRSFIDILRDVSKEFGGSDQRRQVFISEQLFGIRQGKIGIKLLEDLGSGSSVLESALSEAAKAQGELVRDAEIGLTKISVRFQQVGTAYTEVFAKVGQDESLKRFLGEVAGALEGIASLVDVLSGTFPTLLRVGSAALLGLGIKNAPRLLAGLRGGGVAGAIGGDPDDPMAALTGPIRPRGGAGPAAAAGVASASFMRRERARRQFETTVPASSFRSGFSAGFRQDGGVFQGAATSKFATERLSRQAKGERIELARQNKLVAELTSKRNAYAARFGKSLDEYENSRRNLAKKFSRLNDVNAAARDRLSKAETKPRNFRISDLSNDAIRNALGEEGFEAQRRRAASTGRGLRGVLVSAVQRDPEFLRKARVEETKIGIEKKYGRIQDKVASGVGDAATQATDARDRMTADQEASRVARRRLEEAERYRNRLARNNAATQSRLQNERGMGGLGRRVGSLFSPIDSFRRRSVLDQQRRAEMFSRSTTLQGDDLVNAARGETIRQQQSGLGRIPPIIPPGGGRRLAAGARRFGSSAMGTGRAIAPFMLMSLLDMRAQSIQDESFSTQDGKLVNNPLETFRKQRSSSMTRGAMTTGASMGMMGAMFGPKGAAAGLAIGTIAGAARGSTEALNQLTSALNMSVASATSFDEMIKAIADRERILKEVEEGVKTPNAAIETTWFANTLRDMFNNIGDISSEIGSTVGGFGAEVLRGFGIIDPVDLESQTFFGRMQEPERDAFSKQKREIAKEVAREFDARSELERNTPKYDSEGRLVSSAIDPEERLTQIASETRRRFRARVAKDEKLTPDQVSQIDSGTRLDRKQLSELAGVVATGRKEFLALADAFPQVIRRIQETVNVLADFETQQAAFTVSLDSGLNIFSGGFGSNKIGQEFVTQLQSQIEETLRSGTSFGKLASPLQSAGLLTNDENEALSRFSELNKVAQEIGEVFALAGSNSGSVDATTLSDLRQRLSSVAGEDFKFVNRSLDSLIGEDSDTTEESFKQFATMTPAQVARQILADVDPTAGVNEAVASRVRMMDQDAENASKFSNAILELGQSFSTVEEATKNLILSQVNAVKAYGEFEGGSQRLGLLLQEEQRLGDGPTVAKSQSLLNDRRMELFQAQDRMNSARSRGGGIADIAGDQQRVLQAQRNLADSQSAYNQSIVRAASLQEILNQRMSELSRIIDSQLSSRVSLGSSSVKDIATAQFTNTQLLSGPIGDIMRRLGSRGAEGVADLTADEAETLEKFFRARGDQSMRDISGLRTFGALGVGDTGASGNQLADFIAASRSLSFGGTAMVGAEGAVSEADILKSLMNDREETQAKLSQGFQNALTVATEQRVIQQKILDILASRFGTENPRPTVGGQPAASATDEGATITERDALANAIMTLVASLSKVVVAKGQDISGASRNAVDRLSQVADGVYSKETATVDHRVVVSGLETMITADPMIAPVIIGIIRTMRNSLPNTPQNKDMIQALDNTIRQFSDNNATKS
jgi:TP901 family phage tail tape measure protein